MFIPGFGFFSIPDPRVKKAPDPRIRNTGFSYQRQTALEGLVRRAETRRPLKVVVVIILVVVLRHALQRNVQLLKSQGCGSALI
jgi:hypothetical protein